MIGREDLLKAHIILKAQDLKRKASEVTKGTHGTGEDAIHKLNVEFKEMERVETALKELSRAGSPTRSNIESPDRKYNF